MRVHALRVLCVELCDAVFLGSSDLRVLEAALDARHAPGGRVHRERRSKLEAEADFDAFDAVLAVVIPAGRRAQMAEESGAAPGDDSSH